MATTYEAIATTTVGSGGAANIEFTSIPGTYTDLCILLSARQSGTGASNSRLTFNNNTTSYSSRQLYGTGSTAGSDTGSGISTAILAGFSTENNNTASTFSNHQIYVPNYTSSNNKSVSIDAVQETNASTAYMNIVAGLWSNASAITSVKLTPETGSWVQYSTATLYGIKNS